MIFAPNFSQLFPPLCIITYTYGLVGSVGKEHIGKTFHSATATPATGMVEDTESQTYARTIYMLLLGETGFTRYQEP
jgi:hypothetical protein